MKKKLSVLIVLIGLLSLSTFAQNSKVDTTNKLNLPGDNLDLMAVLEVFQKSKTIEAFEKTLNDSKQKINNLDLDLDKKIDFIKVVTEKKGESYMFILRVDISKTETQDVAVIMLDKDKDKKVSLQIVGDEALYGKDYVVEPKGNSSVTPNPGYTGDNPVTETVVKSQTTVVVEQQPIVQYVYSPAYVPYYPPYYYGYYPGWFAFTAVVSFGIYASGCWGYHGHYHGGHYGGGNTVIINNNNNFNNYNNNKMRSNTVNNNIQRGDYGNRGSGNRGSTGVSNNMSNNRGSTGVSNNMSNNKGTGNRGSTGVSNNMSSNRGSSNRTSTSNMSSRPSNMSAGGGRTMGSSRSMGGGGGRRR